MKYLKTKKDRQEMRQKWINGRETTKYKDLEYIAGETTKGEKKAFTLVMWRGTSGKPMANYYYYSQQQRDDAIAYYKKYADQREEYKNNKQVKPELVHSLKKGDLFYTSWGYDQTNYEYIAILEIKGKYAICQRTSALHMGTSGQSNVQEPVFCTFGDMFRMKIQGDYKGEITLRGSYPFCGDGSMEHKRLDTFYRIAEKQQFHETMAEFGH